MVNLVFVVPYALETSLRFVRACAELPGVRLAVVSQEAPNALPRDVVLKLSAHRRVRDAMDAGELEAVTRAISTEWTRRGNGRADRLVGVLEQLQEPMATVRERLRIRGMGLEEARNFRDKARMKEVLRAHDVPCARSSLARDLDEARDFARECPPPWVVKPPAGAGARNTFRVESLDQLADWMRTAAPGEPVLLEEFVTGDEYSFDSVTLRGKHLFHSITRYYPGPLEVMEKPWIQWCVLLPRDIQTEEYDDVRVVGRRALDALGMVTGLSHMEWFRRPDRSIAISEVAARPPGAQFTSLLSWAHDVDFYRAWAELMVFERFEPPERRYAAGAVFLRGQGSGRVVAVHGVEEVARAVGGLAVEARIPEPGQAQASGYEGEGWVCLRHPETRAVVEGLKRVLATIRVELGPSEGGAPPGRTEA